jgi:putative ABC transport system permease protein
MSWRLPLWRRGQEQELDEEIGSHLVEAIRERVERGEPPAAAEAAARREFGPVDLVREVTRDGWGWIWLQHLGQDVRYAFRLLRRSPGFSAITVLTLALGIGANVAIFDVVHAVLLGPLPFPDDDRLAIIGPEWHGSVGSVAPADFLDLRRDNRAFTGMTAVRNLSVDLLEGDQPERVDGAIVTPDFFDVLGVRPTLGRAFLPGESGAGRDHVVVIGDSLWRTRFAASPDILRRTLRLNNEPYTVVGVAPPELRFPEGAELWVPPLYAVPQRIGNLTEDPSTNRGSHYFETYARLRPGVSFPEAQSDVSVIMARIARDFPNADARGGALVRGLREYLVGDSRRALLVMLGAVVLVLSIACANVASLLLARGAARRREIAIRTALGASAMRVVRQVLTESIVLALLGGLGGLVVAAACFPVLVSLVPDSARHLVRLSLEATVLLFALAISLLTGVVFGLSPALGAIAGRGLDALREAGRSGTAGRGGRSFQRVLVAGETALALMLLAGAGLLVRSFLRMRAVDPGFQPSGTIAMSVNLPSAYADPSRRVSYAREVLSNVQQVPGVASSALTTRVPLRHGTSSRGVTVEGRTYTAEQPTEKVIPFYAAATPGYFRTLGIPLVEGRDFTDRDGPGSPKVVIINRALAKAFWPDEDPVGRRIGFGSAQGQEYAEVVGIVADVHTASLWQAPWPMLYAPYEQDPWSFMSFVARTSRPAELVLAEMRQAVQGADRSLAVTGVRTLEQVVAESLAPRRFQTGLLGAFAGLALILAMMGIYGVMSYAVAQRTREIGIRVALGAAPGALFREIVAEGLRVVGVGAVLGLMGAIASRGALQALLFEVSPLDPTTFAGVVVLLVAVALAACLVPASRAMRIDPVVALRTE